MLRREAERASEILIRVKQQQVAGWISLRSSAAHSNLAGYGIVEVEKMIAGVFDFLSDFPLLSLAPAPAANAWPKPSPDT